MRAVVQRVSDAEVTIEGVCVGKIGEGLAILLAVCNEDDDTDLKWLAEKIIGLRIFSDSDDKMNLSLTDVSGQLLIVSQFTLYGDCKKGRRPNFMKSGSPEYAEQMYDKFVEYCKSKIKVVQTGKFGADMRLSLTNNGPVTLIIDSKE